jgi:hypothetical protein
MSRLLVRALVLALSAVLLLATTACGGCGSDSSAPTGPAQWDGATWDGATWEE